MPDTQASEAVETRQARKGKPGAIGTYGNMGSMTAQACNGALRGRCLEQREAAVQMDSQGAMKRIISRNPALESRGSETRKG